MTVKEICTVLGYSRQYYYKYCKYETDINTKNRKIIKLVQTERKRLPVIGTRKLYSLITPSLIDNGIKCGRDKLFTILREQDMLVKPKKRYVQTTMSKHWLRKYPNIAKSLTLDKPEQLWVSDITYLKTDEGNCYLTMVTDSYSRCIMGYNVADNMLAEESVKAFRMAIKNRCYNNDLIHHSDRGLQFCSKEYVDLATKYKINLSMTEKYDPYENALAERMNRTMKEEFGLYNKIKSKYELYKLVDEAVILYNTYRPHLALKMKTPNKIHQSLINKNQGLKNKFIY